MSIRERGLGIRERVIGIRERGMGIRERGMAAIAGILCVRVVSVL